MTGVGCITRVDTSDAKFTMMKSHCTLTGANQTTIFRRSGHADGRRSTLTNQKPIFSLW